jgi:alkylation response protein AidB-like acyl-CoA dehydrogenase
MELLDLRIARVLDQLQQGRAIGTEAALTKLMLGRTEQCIFAAAMEVNGTQGIGWSGDYGAYAEWAEGYLFSRAATIYGGSQEIQKNIVAERILGLPR